MAKRAKRGRLKAADIAFFVAAIIGGLAYAYVLPSQHPDAVADLSLGEEGVIDIAQDFLQETGRNVIRLEPVAEFKRAENLLDSLQRHMGRTAAIALLKEEGATDVLPSHYWEVEWTEQEDENTVYEIWLTQSGRVLGFENRVEGDETVRPDRRALAQALGFGGSEAVSTSLSAVSDSLIQALFYFDLSDSLDQSVISASLLQEGTLPQAFENRRPIALDSAASARLAQYHINKGAFGVAEVSLRVDSVKTLPNDAAAVEVYFSPVRPVEGQVVRLAIEVLPTGAVQDLDVQYNPNSQTASDWRDNAVPITQGVVLFILIVALLVTFFRRLIARAVDVKAALLDGLIIGVLLAVWGAFESDFVQMNGGDDSIWMLLLQYVLALSFLGFLMALGVFLISAATDSVARAVWPEKLRTMAMVRQATLYNQPVGAALVRGTLLAYVTVGLLTLVLFVLPMTRVNLDRYDYVLGGDYSQIAVNFSFAGWLGYLVLLLVLLGVGSFLYKRTKNVVVNVLGMALMMTLIQSFPMVLLPGIFTWVQTGVFALAVVLCFWYFDFVTAFVMFLFTWVIWMSSPGWLMTSSPVELDFILTHATAATAFVFGVAGVYSRNTGLEQAQYVPQYMREVAVQERMKRELELAHQVQESFLPRTMPHVDGLDLAAMCLAAQEVGGDYYDFIKLDDKRLAVVVGDVSGKGIQAAFYMTLTKGFLRTLCRDVPSPAEVLTRVNALFCENVPRGTFISMIYGVVDLEARTFTFARAGHNPVILKRSPSQEPDLVQPKGLAIGLTPGPAFGRTVEEAVINLRIGDVLVFYTDGFSEAMNRRKELYGDDRLARKVADFGQRSASEILRFVAEDVHHFAESAASRHDDMTMLVVKLIGTSVYTSPNATRAKA